jgi:hypothetical protein
MIGEMHTARFSSSSDMQGESEDETYELQEMLKKARGYIHGFKWCEPISEEYLAYGVGGVIALFLFRFCRPVSGSDEWLWTVVGDLPSAYFVVDDARDATSALGVYCDLMEQWAIAVNSKQSLDDVFPVDAPATQANANALISRIKFIRNKVMPAI